MNEKYLQCLAIITGRTSATIGYQAEDRIDAIRMAICWAREVIESSGEGCHVRVIEYDQNGSETKTHIFTLKSEDKSECTV
jgi:hypothetical protein